MHRKQSGVVLTLGVFFSLPLARQSGPGYWSAAPEATPVSVRELLESMVLWHVSIAHLWQLSHPWFQTNGVPFKPLSSLTTTKAMYPPSFIHALKVKQKLFFLVVWTWLEKLILQWWLNPKQNDAQSASAKATNKGANLAFERRRTKTAKTWVAYDN